MSTGKIELSVGAIANKYDIFTEEEIYNINGKVPELDERVGNIEDDIEEINSSLEDTTNEVNELKEVKADKSYVDSAIESVDVSSQLTNYAKKSDLEVKVDKETGKSLISDSEIERLSTLKNYDDTEIKNSLNSKANKTELHSHSNKSVLDGITSTKITEWDNKSDFNGNYNDLTNKPTIPTKTSQLTNDSGFITSIPSEYVTETELNSKGYLTQHQNLSPYAKKTDLPVIVQEIGDSETAVMSQKAVTAFVKETINNYQPPESDGSDGISGGGENYQYPVAISVNQMTDTTKSYLSMETGTLWTYSEVEKEIKQYTNLFVKNDSLQYINQRVNSSQTYVEALGFISTPIIDITDIPAGSEIIVRTKGINWDLASGFARILCYHDGTNHCTMDGGTVAVGGGIPQLCFTYNTTSSLDWTFTIAAGKIEQPIKSIRFVLPIIPDTNITASDVSDDIIITLNEEIKEGTTTIREYEWADTGMTPTYDENTVFIDDVSDCTNVNRNYIMESTRTIWSYIGAETEVEYNAYDPATTKLNYRINSSLAEVSNPGTLLTDYIPLKYKSSGEQMTFKGITKIVPNGSIVFALTYFDSTKKPIKSENGNPWGYGGTAEHTLPITIDPFALVNGVENTEYIKVRLSISTKTITASDVAGLVINVKSLNTKQIAKVWTDTNIKPSYAGTIEVVNTVDEMTDTRRSYILKSTGTLWEYAPKKGDMINLYDPTKVQYNNRYSGSPGSIVQLNGYMVLPEIPIDMTVDEPRLIVKHDGILGYGESIPSWQKATPLDINKNALGVLYVNPDQNNANRMKMIKISEQEFHLYPRFNATGENSYWKDIKYVQLDTKISASVISSGAEHITGIYNPDYCETAYEWADTGIFLDDGSGGGVSGGSGNYLDLLIKVNKTQKDVDDLEDRLTTVESNIGGDATVPSAWKSAVEECITNIKSHQVGIHCVTFPFFSDHHVRGGYTGLLISKVMKECNIPYCFFGGDSISSGYIEEEETMINQELQFKKIMSYIPDGRFYKALGNHDGYMIHKETDNVLWDRDRIYELFMRDTGLGQFAYFGDDGTYFYVNDIPSKTRFIVLNPNGNYTSEQLDWLQNVAMKFDQPGWGIVFISHQGISAHYHSAIGNVNEVRTILTNYKNSTDANKADLISWHSGHIHRDRIYVGQAINTTDDQVGAALPVKNVTITSDNVAIAYDDATKHANDNSNLSHAIDFVTINRKTRTVKITRLGIGEDREFTF